MLHLCAWHGGGEVRDRMMQFTCLCLRRRNTFWLQCIPALVPHGSAYTESIPEEMVSSHCGLSLSCPSTGACGVTELHLSSTLTQDKEKPLMLCPQESEAAETHPYHPERLLCVSSGPVSAAVTKSSHSPGTCLTMCPCGTSSALE